MGAANQRLQMAQHQRVPKQRYSNCRGRVAVTDPVAVAVALALEQRWEGFQSLPYLCPAGVPSIGYGFTHYADGRRVTLKDPAMTREEAATLLEFLTREQYMRSAMLLCPNIDTPQRLGAITDFEYNTGALRSSTLRRKINAGLWDQVPAELRKWIHAGGRVQRGLILRREAEIAYI